MGVIWLLGVSNFTLNENNLQFKIATKGGNKQNERLITNSRFPHIKRGEGIKGEGGGKSGGKKERAEGDCC